MWVAVLVTTISMITEQEKVFVSSYRAATKFKSSLVIAKKRVGSLAPGSILKYSFQMVQPW